MSYTLDQYKRSARNFATKYSVTSEHVIDIISSVMMTRDGVIPGGSFVQSVVSNNLFEAINRADTECLQNLRVIVAARYNAHPINDL